LTASLAQRYAYSGMEAIVPLRVVAKLARFAGIKSLTLRPPPQNQTLTIKPNHFDVRFTFSLTMEGVCSAQVQAQNEHNQSIAGD